ncbi:MAG: ATP-binding protein, partial [Oscillospiraceae bacterium]
LIREWAFYPGVVLTPEEVAHRSGYRTSRDVGGRGGETAGGCTYQLTLELPPTVRTYALELPEIFSACRLYVDGRPAFQLGNPDETAYAEGIGSRTVVFPAAGRVSFLLAVSARAGVYDGLTYPPAFGTVEAVQRAREARLLLHGLGGLLALLAAAFSVTFAWRGNRRRGVLFLLCSLCFAVITGYPLLHGLAVVSYGSWYVLEAVGLYGLLLLTVLLSCDLSEIPPPWAALLAAPCGLGLLCAIARTVGAGGESAAFAGLFSLLSLVLKVYAALCLPVLAALALKRGKNCPPLLLCGVLAFSVCLAFDRLLPLYEPIYGGWFEEVGGAILAVALANLLWMEAMEAYRFQLNYAGELRQLEHHLELQKEHYRQLSAQVQRAREASHDLRHHMRTLRGMAEQGKLDKVVDYLDAYEPHLRAGEITVYSDHPVADALLSHYAAAADALGASCKLRFAVPPELALPDDELCILLGNLLENATEAMERQKTGPRRLLLQGDVSEGRLRLLVENSFDGVVRLRDEEYLSSKRSGLGLGLRSVHTIVEKYGGVADFAPEGGTFRSSILLPLPAVSPERPGDEAVAETVKC